MPRRRNVSARKRMGARVRELRLERKYNNPASMARAMQARFNGDAITRERIGKIERGGTELTALELLYLAQLLNYPLEEFYKQPYGQVPRSTIKAP